MKQLKDKKVAAPRMDGTCQQTSCPMGTTEEKVVARFGKPVFAWAQICEYTQEEYTEMMWVFVEDDAVATIYNHRGTDWEIGGKGDCDKLVRKLRAALR
mgnify:CR=1 FL=1